MAGSYSDYVRITGSAASSSTIDDFEDSDLSEYTDISTDNGTTRVTSTAAFQGSSGLELTLPSGSSKASIVSTSGLDRYPQPDEEFVVPFEYTTDTGIFLFQWSVTDETATADNYQVQITESHDMVIFTPSGPIGQTHVNKSGLVNTKLQLRVQWDSDGKIKVTLEDYGGGTTYGTASGTESTLDSNGVRFSLNATESETTLYYDEIEKTQFGVSPTVSDNLVAGNSLKDWLTLNHGDGTDAYDLIDSDGDSVVNGATWSSTAKEGTSLSFDGASDFLAHGDGKNGSTKSTFSAYTMMCWVRFDSAVIESSTASCPLSFFDNNKIFFNKEDTDEVRAFHGGSSTNSSIQTSFSVSDDTWYHFAASWDGATHSFYLDGSKIGSNSVSDMSSFSRDDKIGGYTDSNGNIIIPMNGYIDDFRIYDTKLSGTQIQNIHDATK